MIGEQVNDCKGEDKRLDGFPMSPAWSLTVQMRTNIINFIDKLESVMIEVAVRQRFHDLYVDHQAWLNAWLRKKLGCPAHAEDVAQNTFLRALGAGDALLRATQPRAWLVATAKNLLIDEARRREVEQAYLAELALRAEGHESASPEAVFQAVQALVEFLCILDTVSDKARHAFVRHYFDGETHACIADELGVSTRMVQKYLAQVLVQSQLLGLHPLA